MTSLPSSQTPNQAVSLYGWTAVPRDVHVLLQSSQATGPARAITISEIEVPKAKLVEEVLAYAKRELNVQTFNHSMRVYYYGISILHHAFPTWLTPSLTETYFLTCLLHDIGTTARNMPATMMSFEFYGGMIALDLLKSHSAPVSQAESVTEAVIRHQDLGVTGTLTQIGALIQLATIFDNMGGNPQLIHVKTIENVVEAYPRKGWSGCFAATIRRENGLKPWAHTTHLGERDFPEGVEGNELMAPYDG